MADLPIPGAALDEDIAILGRKGGGKTITAKKIVERSLDLGRRVLVLDPLGVWAGLRTAANGTDPGYPVAIFGGVHGDLPLDAAAGEPLARVIAATNLPAVIDLSDLSKTKQQAFLLAFLHELRRVNTEALTLVLEEADVFAPQQPQGDDSKMLHSEIDWIARRGRFKGFRLITITQRPARLSKDVLTQAATLIAHRLPAPQDREAVKAWVDGNGDRDAAKEVFDTLAGLAVGEAWIWSTVSGDLKRARFPMIRTLDTSATPRAGEKRIEPKTLADVDLGPIRDALAKAEDERAEKAAAKSDKQKLTVAKMDDNRPDPAAIAEAEERGYQAGYAQAASEATTERAKIGRQLLAGIRSTLIALGGEAEFTLPETAETTPNYADPIQGPTPARVKGTAPNPVLRQGSSLEPRLSGAGFNSAAAKLLAVMDTSPPVKRTWQQVATLAGLKARGGHFNAGKKSLIDSGLVIESGGLVAIAKPSDGAAPPATDPAALVEMWANALSGAAPKILRCLFEQGGMEFRPTLAVRLGMKPLGGHWNDGWKQLRDNGIVTVDSDIAQLTELFRP